MHTPKSKALLLIGMLVTSDELINIFPKSGFNNPIIILVVFKSQPNTVDKIIEGAKMVIPADKLLWIKKRIAVRDLVFKSKRLSKNS